MPDGPPFKIWLAGTLAPPGKLQVAGCRLKPSESLIFSFEDGRGWSGADASGHAGEGMSRLAMPHQKGQAWTLSILSTP